jgi:hypothetical protein
MKTFTSLIAAMTFAAKKHHMGLEAYVTKVATGHYIVSTGE